MLKRIPLVLMASFALLAGCGVNSSNPPPSNNFQAEFYLSSTGGFNMPFPNDLYFSGSKDGTVNIQGLSDPTNYSNPLVAINTLDGFSSTAPITEQFNKPLDPKSLSGNVYVFSVTTDPTLGYAVTGVNGLLTEGTDYTLSVSAANPSVLEITPTGTLGANASYMVVTTNGIKDTNGDSAGASPDFTTIKNAIANNTTPSNPLLAQAEPLFAAMLGAANQAAGINPSSVSMIWTFTTQSEGDVLQNIAKNAQPGKMTLLDTGKTTTAFDSALPGYAEVFVGKLSIPYYSGIPSKADPTAPLHDFWHGAGGSLLTRYNVQAAPTGTVTIPVIMTIPDSSSPYSTYPSSGWPVAIFQHGITGNRTNDLAVADSYAKAGIATIAIDLPLHGITNKSNPFYDNQLADQAPVDVTTGVAERTFNLPAPAPATGIAPSGTYFINLNYLLTSRDNLREAVADLLHLTETLPTASFTTAGGATEKFNTLATYFSSISLGSIVGVPYLAEVPNIPNYNSTIKVQSAFLSEPGGKVAYLLETSPTFSPEINQGLAQVGLVPGTQGYDTFFQDAQTVVDSGDPLNYAATAAANIPINMTEVVGNSSNPPDNVVPNWTENLLVNAMGLTTYTQTATNTNGIRGLVKFNAGAHASLLDPSYDPTVTQQMQTQMVAFAAGCPAAVCGTALPPNGQTMLIQYPSVVTP